MGQFGGPFGSARRSRDLDRYHCRAGSLLVDVVLSADLVLLLQKLESAEHAETGTASDGAYGAAAVQCSIACARE